MNFARYSDCVCLAHLFRNLLSRYLMISFVYLPGCLGQLVKCSLELVSPESDAFT